MEIKALLNEIPKEKLNIFLSEEMTNLMKTNPKMYYELEDRLYTSMYGHHFTASLYNQAVKELSKGEHWSFNEIADYAASKNMKYDSGFNEYDFAYTMNLLYSEYSGIINGNETFFNMAKSFLSEPDNVHGKAYRYYRCLEECK